MSALTNDCKECGRPLAGIDDRMENQLLCGMNLMFRVPSRATEISAACAAATIVRLKARVTELELIAGARPRVWELSGGDIWIVAHTEEDCWRYLEDQHGNTDEEMERKEAGDSWTPLPDDKRITMYVDEEGDVCNYDDGAPCAMPAWVWAVRHGVGFLGEAE
jgi:hypothetical protein